MKSKGCENGGLDESVRETEVAFLFSFFNRAFTSNLPCPLMVNPYCPQCSMNFGPGNAIKEAADIEHSKQGISKVCFKCCYMPSTLKMIKVTRRTPMTQHFFMNNGSGLAT